MKITFYGNSDIGRVRKTNEDNFSGQMIGENEHLFIVADGMGGHQAGEVASKLGTNSFIRKYRKSRKEGKGIEESMLHSLQQANSSILKRALTDPSKRGMGTTFTVLVIYNRKATIVHIGDSRIYLIRNNKIKKITTDHTFVEKMLKDGKINEKEARDHPQKNILYMSLGARKTYIPEILSDIDIKKGDVITMCSDGLNNMVEDEMIKKYSLGDDPEKSVKELINLANENGGTDNITIQIIHAGELLKRKKPKSPKKRTRLQKAALSLILALFSSFLLLLLNWKTIESHPNLQNDLQYSSFMNPKFQGMKRTETPNKQNLFKINTPTFPAHLSRDDFLFVTGDYIIFRQRKGVSIYSILKQEIITNFLLKPTEKLIPSIFASVSSSDKLSSVYRNNSFQIKTIAKNFYIFERAKTKFLKYQIVQKNSGKTLITIQSDPELNSVDHETRTVKFLKLAPPLIPIFINQRAFIFHDQKSFYVIEYPIKQKNNEIKFYKANEMEYTQNCFISIKTINKTIKILFFDVRKKIIKEFEIPISDQNDTRKILFEFTEKPLNIEYVNENSIIIYFSNGYIDIKKNNSFVHNYYVYQNENISIQRVLLDFTSNKKILVDKYNRLFILIL